MRMVGEYEDLGLLAQLLKNRKEGLDSRVVESHQEVIKNERDGSMVFQMERNRGEAEGEIELVGRAFG